MRDLRAFAQRVAAFLFTIGSLKHRHEASTIRLSGWDKYSSPVDSRAGDPFAHANATDFISATEPRASLRMPYRTGKRAEMGMSQPFKPTKQQLIDAAGKTVPDVIAKDLRVLFCGINPSLYTAAVGHHFAR